MCLVRAGVDSGPLGAGLNTPDLELLLNCSKLYIGKILLNIYEWRHSFLHSIFKPVYYWSCYGVTSL